VPASPNITAPLIICEGPDGAGKTTLARELGRVASPAVLIHADRHGDDPLHRPFNERLMMEYHAQILAKAQSFRAAGKAAILDRHWISHIAYGAAAETLRAGALFAYRAQFEPYVNAMGAFYVFAVDPKSVETALAHQDPDHPRERALLEKVLSAYSYELQVMWARPAARCIAYHWTVHGSTPAKLEDFARLVLSLATSAATPAASASG
jgi:thymidylate kinase